ncbi:MAG: biotin/lipoyl-containing protein, partial [Pseudomonadota bacterium]
VNYRGAGTVEFLYDSEAGAVYFMEMNTRLQVEHPVSEMITGVDLVEWQLRVAAGERLPATQDEIGQSGHAFEARLYAEDPDRDFAPSIGRLETLRLPDALARVDSGVEAGQDISPYYDPMIAKIIIHGSDRADALRQLSAALKTTRTTGLETNARFLDALATHPSFAAGDVSTRFIDQHSAALFAESGTDPRAYAAALLWRLGQSRSGGDDPWDALTGFRLNRPTKAVLWLEIEGASALARMIRTPDAINVEIEPNASAAARRSGDAPGAAVLFAFDGVVSETGDFHLTLDDVRTEGLVAPHRGGVRVFIGSDHWDVAFADPLSGEMGGHSAEGSLAAPMPGVITLLKAEIGATVAAGDTLLVMEAMKMEHAIKAPHDGVVKGFRFAQGDQVKDGDLLVDFEETA